MLLKNWQDKLQGSIATPPIGDRSEFPGLDKAISTGSRYSPENPYGILDVDSVAPDEIVERPTIAAIPHYPKPRQPKSYIFPTRSQGEVEEAMKKLGFPYGSYKMIPIPLVLPDEIPYDGNKY